MRSRGSASWSRVCEPKGVRAIRGDIVGDGSYFESTLVHPNWEAFDLNWWYAAPVSGLGFHDNSVDFQWQPGQALGAPAVITMNPDLGDIGFENRTVTVAPGGESDVGDRFFRQPGTLQVWAEGTVARSTTHRTPNRSPCRIRTCTPPRALRQALADAGIAVTGTTRSTTDSTALRGIRATPPLAEVSSRPLTRLDLSDSANTSQILVCGDAAEAARPTIWQGRLVARRPRGRAPVFVDSVRVDSTQFSLSDGSGLSSSNLVSPLRLPSCCASCGPAGTPGPDFRRRAAASGNADCSRPGAASR